MRCFSSPRSPSYKRMLSLQLNGLPHSDIRGSRVICTSPQLFAAYHVLLRLREPRHPPFALAYFFFLDIINILAENVLIIFSSSLLLLYNFFLIRHIYIRHAETKRLLSCDRKLFLLYVVNSRLKKFFCCLLQGIILSSQITIYTSHCTFLLLQYVNDLCRRSEYLRIDSFVSLRELPLAKILSQISQESNASEAALSKSDCKSNTFLLHHQTFCKLF